MNDIVKDAKQLLEGATPGPWVINGEFDPECPELQGAPQLENGLLKVPIISHDIYGDFFPEDGDLIAKSWTNARALAEETWEYAVQAKTGSKWEHMQDGFFRDAWFSELRKAKAGARELRSIGKETRIVRRRVSQPEVVSE